MIKDEMRALPIETLCSMFELTTSIINTSIITVRGWIMDIVREKNPSGFDAWISDEYAEDSDLKRYLSGELCNPLEYKAKEVYDEIHD